MKFKLAAALTCTALTAAAPAVADAHPRAHTLKEYQLADFIGDGNARTGCFIGARTDAWRYVEVTNRPDLPRRCDNTVENGFTFYYLSYPGATAPNASIHYHAYSNDLDGGACMLRVPGTPLWAVRELLAATGTPCR